MKSFVIETHVTSCTFQELPERYKTLIEEAKKQTKNAYAPYSHFQVGAAVLLANEEIISGNNQENSAYPSGLCAERTAMFYANAQHPDTAVEAIAIAAFKNDRFIAHPITPCGSCRQVLLETETRFNKDIKVILYGEKKIYIIANAKHLLPLSFGKELLEE